MATSGTYTLSASRDDLITFAFKKAGIIPEGATPNANQLTDGQTELNYIYALWQTDGLQLWARKQAVLFPQASKSKYAAGPTGDHLTDSSSFESPTLSAAAAASDTVITVSSITGISSGDYIGVILDDGTSQWTTVNGAPSGSSVTLTTGLTGPASSGNQVYVYTAKIQRPLRILDGFRRIATGTSTNNLDVPLKLIALEDYDTLTNKNQQGTILQVCYDPQLDNGEFYVWMVPNQLTELIYFRYHVPFQMFTSGTDDIDCPDEWYLALGYQLAANLGDTYGIPSQKQGRLDQKAMYFHQKALTWSIEPEGFRIEPNEDDYPYDGGTGNFRNY